MRIFKFSAVIVIFSVAVVLCGNWIALDRQVSEALAQDPRNKGIRLAAYLAKGIDPSTLVLDLRALGEHASMADIDRALLTSLKALKNYSFSRVVLAYNANHKFQMTGSYAKMLGEEYGIQNVVYTMRTMQENIFKVDGSPAFGTWTGGWLGVAGKQMEDHNKFHKAWWVDDATQ